MRAQYLDSMDLERERGITIKAQNVRLEWNGYVINLIDTPGHVDFGYEVSPVSLAACEGVILLVDASQGIEAQTLANCYLALEHDLDDRRRAQQDRPARGRARPATPTRSSTCSASRPTRSCASRPRPARASPSCSTRSIERIPPPKGDPDAPLQALIFDSYYDPYRGVVVVGAGLQRHARAAARGCASCRRGATHDAEEIGVRAARCPRRSPTLGPGEVGYLIAGIKDVGEARVGETVTDARPTRREPLEGYRDPKPMVFCGLYPVDGDEYADLREALEKLRLNDSSFTYEPETSGALGFGFRCGFLGLLHMEIVRERLEREYDLVARRHRAERRVPACTLTDGDASRSSTTRRRCRRRTRSRRSRSRSSTSRSSRRPSTSARSWSCARHRRGEMQKMEYLSAERVELVYALPLGRDRHRLLRPDEVAARRATPASTTSPPATARRTW